MTHKGKEGAHNLTRIRGHIVACVAFRLLHGLLYLANIKLRKSIIPIAL